jgi:uncharacterized membrane protein
MKEKQITMTQRLSEISSSRKAEARLSLIGNFGTVIGAEIFNAICLLIGYQIIAGISLGTSLWNFIGGEIAVFIVTTFMGIFTFGLYFILMSLAYDQKPVFRDLFRGFRKENSDRVVKMEAVLAAIELACMLPAQIVSFVAGSNTVLIIVLYAAGIVLSCYVGLTFAMGVVLLIDFPDMMSTEALRTSANMMKGNKGKLLYIELSFIPLYLLGIISCGIADLWVYAYNQMTVTSFYHYLASEKK